MAPNRRFVDSCSNSSKAHVGWHPMLYVSNILLTDDKTFLYTKPLFTQGASEVQMDERKNLAYLQIWKPEWIVEKVLNYYRYLYWANPISYLVIDRSPIFFCEVLINVGHYDASNSTGIWTWVLSWWHNH